MGDTNQQQEFSVDLLRVYYDRLFPYDHMYNWLSYWNGPECSLISNDQVIDRDFFPKREWSFTIENDIYIRYQSFRDKNEFAAAIQKRQPHKIDIGAVFTHFPKEHNNVKPDQFKPKERELVFDIDMTDYDNIRRCCTGANICRKCWPYMTMAIKVIDESLRNDFAFQNILWIYSGRRGVHCWVCDKHARELTNEQRSAIVEYLTVETGTSENSEKKLKNVFLANGQNAIHPMIRRAYDTLEPFFEKYIIGEEGQSLLSNPDSYRKVIATIPESDLRVSIFEEIEKDKATCATSDHKKRAFLRWKIIKQRTINDSTQNTTSSNTNQNKKKKYINYAELEAWRIELVFTHCYPRLDANVSKSQNHLLKSPFCIHPKTGRVCVPIDPKLADDFDPFSVPTLRVLCEEVDKYDSKNKTTVNDAQDPATVTVKSEKETFLLDYEKTSLKQALKTFEKTFLNDLKSSVKKTFKDKENQIAAMNIEF